LACRGPDAPIAQPPFRGRLVLAPPGRGRDRPLAAARPDVRRGPAYACSMGPGRGRPSGVLGSHRMVGRHRAGARRAALRVRPGRTSATANDEASRAVEMTRGEGPQGIVHLLYAVDRRAGPGVSDRSARRTQDCLRAARLSCTSSPTSAATSPTTTARTPHARTRTITTINPINATHHTTPRITRKARRTVSTMCPPQADATRRGGRTPRP
jgi:hypothetical protein